MKPATAIRSLFLQYFAKPRHLRGLYKYLASNPVLRIVQIGVGDGNGTEAMLELVLRKSGKTRARFTGIDMFEGRPQSAPGMTLKAAHRRFLSDALDIRLMPGEPANVLSRFANELRGTDLVIVSHDQHEGMAQAWHLVARFLHKDSQVWIEERNDHGAISYQVLNPAQVRERTPIRRTKAA